MKPLQSAPLPGGSFTLNEWLAHRRISRAKYYDMVERGTAPRTHRIGCHVRISAEADAAWLAQQEKAADVE